MLTLLLGGARSGKSALAVDLAAAAEGPVTFVATAEAGDEDMAARIVSHRAGRPVTWATHEVPVALGEALARVPEDHVVIVDCLTLWVSNLFGAGWDDAAIWAAAAALATGAARRRRPTIVVSNEVGAGIVPADALSRRYRDVLGRVNTIFAAAAGQALLVVAGRVLDLQPAPVGRSRP
jgi:adenosyl cobinamide kinase/adenosyl cobinamide phosphate guanylyltransferase